MDDEQILNAKEHLVLLSMAGSKQEENVPSHTTPMNSNEITPSANNEPQDLAQGSTICSIEHSEQEIATEKEIIVGSDSRQSCLEEKVTVTTVMSTSDEKRNDDKDDEHKDLLDDVVHSDQPMLPPIVPPTIVSGTFSLTIILS